MSVAANKGWGPSIYLIAMAKFHKHGGLFESIQNNGLVEESALNIWKMFKQNQPNGLLIREQDDKMMFSIDPKKDIDLEGLEKRGKQIDEAAANAFLKWADHAAKRKKRPDCFSLKAFLETRSA